MAKVSQVQQDNQSLSRRAQKGNQAAGGSDTHSAHESLEDEKIEREAFWGLVRLFIECHEGENKDYKEMSGVGDAPNFQALKGESASIAESICP